MPQYHPRHNIIESLPTNSPPSHQEKRANEPIVVTSPQRYLLCKALVYGFESATQIRNVSKAV